MKLRSKISLFAISALALFSTPVFALDAFSEAGPTYIETSAPAVFTLSESSSMVVPPNYKWGYNLFIGRPTPRFWTGTTGFNSVSFTNGPGTLSVTPATYAVTQVSVEDQERGIYGWQNATATPGSYAFGADFSTITVDRRLRTGSVHLTANDLSAVPPELTAASNFIRQQAPAQVRDAVDQIMATNSGDLVAAIRAMDKWVCDHITYSADADTDNLATTDMAGILRLGKGVCGHYSGLLSGMANVAGIPGRFVGGALIDIPGPSPQTTTQSAISHVWTEVYLPNIGWTEIEPQAMKDPNGNPFFVNRFHIKGAWGSNGQTLTQISGPSATNNIPPTVKLLPISSTGVAKLNQTVTIAAAAADADGFVSQVQFYQYAPSGAWEKIGMAMTPPYAVSWTPTQTGDYNVYAYAFDQFGKQSADTAPVLVKVSATAPPTPAITAVPDQLANISTRLRVGTGDDVMIGGFIVTAPAGQTKKVLVRGIGPAMAALGVPGTLANPMLELHDGTGAIVGMNDDWKTTQVGGLVTGSQMAAIQATGFAPTNDKESALLADLPAGNYTVIIRGANSTSGVALVEVYDLDPAGAARLANISTRGPVGTGDNVMIGGTIVQGLNAQRIMVRASGPTLTTLGVPGAVADPMLELHDGNGALIASNDNWKQADNATYIAASGFAPSNDNEAAIMTTVLPGNYTMIVRGVNNTIGVALVEVFHLP